MRSTPLITCSSGRSRLGLPSRRRRRIQRSTRSRPVNRRSEKSARRRAEGKISMKTRCACGCLGVLLTLFGGPGQSWAEPGDLLGFIPLAFDVPTDIAYDDEDGTYWLLSGAEHSVYHLSRDLKELLGTIQLPFQNAQFSLAMGIAYVPKSATLFIISGP